MPSYTLNTAVPPLDEAAVEVIFKMTNFKEGVLLTPKGNFLRSKSFCMGWGSFVFLRVFPSGAKGELGKILAY